MDHTYYEIIVPPGEKAGFIVSWYPTATIQEVKISTISNKCRYEDALRVGDVIFKINNFKVNTMKDFRTALESTTNIQRVFFIRSSVSPTMSISSCSKPRREAEIEVNPSSGHVHEGEQSSTNQPQHVETSETCGDDSDSEHSMSDAELMAYFGQTSITKKSTIKTDDGTPKTKRGGNSNNEDETCGNSNSNINDNNHNNAEDRGRKKDSDMAVIIKKSTPLASAEAMSDDNCAVDTAINKKQKVTPSTMTASPSSEEMSTTVTNAEHKQEKSLLTGDRNNDDCSSGRNVTCRTAPPAAVVLAGKRPCPGGVNTDQGQRISSRKKMLKLIHGMDNSAGSPAKVTLSHLIVKYNTPPRRMLPTYRVFPKGGQWYATISWKREITCSIGQFDTKEKANLAMEFVKDNVLSSIEGGTLDAKQIVSTLEEAKIIAEGGVLHVLTPKDVVIGKGSRMSPGNKMFQEVCDSYANKYRDSNNFGKNSIVNDIIYTFMTKGGFFVRLLNSEDDPHAGQSCVIVSHALAYEKTRKMVIKKHILTPTRKKSEEVSKGPTNGIPVHRLMIGGEVGTDLKSTAQQPLSSQCQRPADSFLDERERKYRPEQPAGAKGLVVFEKDRDLLDDHHLKPNTGLEQTVTSLPTNIQTTTSSLLIKQDRGEPLGLTHLEKSDATIDGTVSMSSRESVGSTTPTTGTATEDVGERDDEDRSEESSNPHKTFWI